MDGLFLDNDMQPPPPHLKKVAGLSQNDTQCYETHEKMIFPILFNFFVQQNYHIKFLRLLGPKIDFIFFNKKIRRKI